MVSNSKLAHYSILFAKLNGIICMTDYHYSNIKESEVLIKLKNKKYIV